MGHCRTLEPRKDVVKVKTATKYINFFGDLDDYLFFATHVDYLNGYNFYMFG